MLIRHFAEIGNKAEIKDIEAYASECLIGILQVPTDMLFNEAIAVTRTLHNVQTDVASGTHLTCTAEISRDLSTKDVEQLVQSMLGKLYRDFDGGLSFREPNRLQYIDDRLREQLASHWPWSPAAWG
jgi:hypothetical protein